jgi:hypothetical protein
VIVVAIGASEDDVVSPLVSSQISNSTTSRKRFFLMFGIISLFIHEDRLIGIVYYTSLISISILHCRCGSVFTYKEDGTTGSSSLNRHLRTCTVKNANTNQACIVYDSYQSVYHKCS